MIVVACDSVLNLDGRILGKPHTAERARQWWRRMRGHQGVLVSGHHVAVIVNGQLREQTRIGREGSGSASGSCQPGEIESRDVRS